MLIPYIEKGNLKEIYEFLSGHPAFDINDFDEEYASWPLEWAIDCPAIGQGNSDIIRLLLDNGANPDGCGEYPPLWLVASHGRVDLVRLFLEYGANPSIVSAEDGSTPLIIASKRGHFNVVEILVKAGAQLATEDAEGQSALSMAIAQGEKEIATYLSTALAQTS